MLIIESVSIHNQVGGPAIGGRLLRIGVALALVAALGSTATSPARAGISPAALHMSLSVEPGSRPEPGGEYTFSVTIRNVSIESQFRVGELVNSVHGDLTQRGNCGALLEVGFFQAGQEESCSYVVTFEGVGGSTQTSTTSVSSPDIANSPVSAEQTIGISDIPPSAAVEVTAQPQSRLVPGGIFDHTVEVRNTSGEAVQITRLFDDQGPLNRRGDCADTVGLVLRPGIAASCTYPVVFESDGPARRATTVSVEVQDDEQSVATATDSVTISVLAPPSTTSTTTGPSPTTSTTRPPTGSSTTTPTPTSSTSPSTTSTTLATTDSGPGGSTSTSAPGLELLSGPSTEPGGEVRVRGQGCSPGALVSLAVANQPVGRAQADEDGVFEATLPVTAVDPGRITVVGLCDVRLATAVDVVLTTNASGTTSTLGVFLFFLLLALMLFRRRRFTLARRE